MEKATRQQTKEHNRNLVLKILFEHESISRAEIARITSLTRTTVSDIVTDLIAEGLVSEIGVGESLGGKSPILLSLVDDSRTLIGLDLAHDRFYGAIINLRGKIRETLELPVNDCKGEAALAAVYEILDPLVQAAHPNLVGIGIGTPGLVNTREGIVINAVNLDWRDLPLAHLLQSRYGVPVYVINDSQAAAMGEYTFGEGHQSDHHLIVINARQGIGAGIVIDGQTFQGDGGGAGEIGHVVVVHEGGLPCRCGNLGCLETVASTAAVLSRAQMLVLDANHISQGGDSHKLTIEAMERAFFAGNPLVRRVVVEAGRYMGLAISSLVGTLNIQKIVLAGDMTRFGQPWLDAIQETMAHTTLSRLAQDTQVEIGRLGENGIVLGASALLLKDYSLLFMRTL